MSEELRDCGIALLCVFRFFGLGFIGLGESVGGWRKAVSRMAAPRGLVVGHP